MIRWGRWQLSLEGLFLVALAVFLTLGVGRCGGRRDAATDARIARLRAESTRLSASLDAAHDSIAVLQARAAKAEAGERQARGRQVAAERRLASALDSAEAVLADSNASREALQVALGRLTVDARALVTLNAVYRDSVAAMRVAFDAERVGYRNALAVADSTIDAERRTNTALTDAARCEVLGVSCPTRWQTFWAGVVTTLAVVVVL